jgi:8-oxo-dGTP pyrophosphatase MutT (NUDIX family)
VSDTDREAGVAILVWRRAPEIEILLLHRIRLGAEFNGDWAWTTPGGGVEPGEDATTAARRELAEETGLVLDCEQAWPEAATAGVSAFIAEASPAATVRLSVEHDRHEWVTPSELERCRPAWVAEMYRQLVIHVTRGQTRV